jgi:sugar-specific transcriptional regulator TrmB
LVKQSRRLARDVYKRMYVSGNTVITFRNYGGEMKHSSTLSEKLKTLGLTENECKAYFTLLKLGAGTVIQISREAHLQRTEIYSLMSGLVSKGLVEETIDRPRRYKPVNVRQALPRLVMRIRERLDKTAKESEELAVKLERFSVNPIQTGESPEEIHVVYGAHAARAHILETVRSAKNEFWGMAGHHRPPHISDRSLAEILKVIGSKKLKAKFIIEVDRENRRRVARMTPVAEVSHYQPIPAYMYGADDRTFAVSLAEEPIARPSQVVQLVSTYRPTVRIMRQFFEILWHESVPFALHEASLSGGQALGLGSLMTRGRMQGYARAQALMRSAKKSVMLYAPCRFEPIRLLKGVGDILLDAHSRGVKGRMIVALSEENQEAVKKFAGFMEVRNTTKGTLGFSFDIVDEVNAEICYVHQDIKDLDSRLDFAIQVTSREGIRHISNLFDVLWEESVPIEQAMQEYRKHLGESPSRPC